jgi:hypothetical protein
MKVVSSMALMRSRACAHADEHALAARGSEQSEGGGDGGLARATLADHREEAAVEEARQRRIGHARVVALTPARTQR